MADPDRQGAYRLLQHLATGFSTFMIEMTETTNILHNVIERSLAPVDEIGRSNMYIERCRAGLWPCEEVDKECL